MEVKKLAIGIVAVACLAIFMVGCTKEENNKETKEEIKVEQSEDKASEKIATEFKEVLESKDTLKIKEFISKNIQNVNRERANRMVFEYELLLNEEFKELIKKYNSKEYYMAINETKDKEHNLNVEEIKDQKIKEEVKHLLASGYTFKMLEGDYYLAIDYPMLEDDFSQYLSEEYKAYYRLRKKEFEKPIFVEEYVSVEPQEVKNRVSNLEKIIRNNKKFAKREDIKDMMKWYVQALLTVDYFNNAVDYETGEVKESIKGTYEDLKGSDLKIAKYAAEEMDQLLREYEYVLKPKDEKAYEKVNNLKFKIRDEVWDKIDEYYLDK